MFRPIETTAARRPVTLHVQGQAIQARAGDTLAIALLNAGVVTFRHTPVSGQPRGPLCMMGVCFDCLVEVDGRQNVQSCMVEVRDGMQVSLPAGARRAEDAQ
jgi:predicted molibdopterin-dependent oxidoreductase YjgC